MTKITLFELQEKLATLSAAIQADAEWLVAKAADPNVPMEDITAKEQHRAELESRKATLAKQAEMLEAQQRESVKTKDVSPEQTIIKAKADFYRAVLNGNVADAKKAYTALGAIPASDADLGYGDRLLPTNMSNELIVEPVVENPMRAIVRLSNITGLEEPKLSFDLDDAYNDVTDKQTANEIAMEGDTVIYSRHKVKVRAKVSDTVIHGTNTNLVTEIENALRSGLAANEMSRMFAASPASGYEAMSFYSTANNITAVNGATKQKAIAAALADLPIAFRRNAKIVMSATDWFDMWGDNLNQSGMFFENRPLILFGKEVILVDDAVYPVVGDFSYARINYDIGATYDTDKDVDSGIYKFVLTAWYDIKLRLKSAFRLAKVVNP